MILVASLLITHIFLGKNLSPNLGTIILHGYMKYVLLIIFLVQNLISSHNPIYVNQYDEYEIQHFC